MELFRAARLKNQPYEMVITDLGMPDVDGHQVARTIKAESPGTPVIMMTGWGTIMKEDGENAPEVDAVVGKPPRIARVERSAPAGSPTTDKRGLRRLFVRRLAICPHHPAGCSPRTSFFRAERPECR